MTDKLKTAFDGICAEEILKSNTILFLQNEIQKRDKIKKYTMVKNYAVAFASVIIICLSGIFAYNVYYSPVAYVDVDVNPSIALTLNRFDRVIDAHAYNDDGGEIIKSLLIKHKGYDEALVSLIDAISEQGYFQDGGLVSVTLQTNNKNKEKVLLTNIQTGIESYLTGHHQTAQFDVFPVSGDTRYHSHELGISPAKYLALQVLIEVDPTASIESCRDHSIIEIKQLTQEHVNHHGNGSVGSGEPSTGDVDSSNDDCDDDVKDSGQANGHHGDGH